MSSPEQSGKEVAFLCGALRSGTTLAALMLGAHPLITRAGEMDFLFESPRAADGTPDLKAYRRMLADNRIFRAGGVGIDENLAHDDLVRSFVEQKREPGRALVATVHRNFQRIPAIFPGARYIHLLRDPRDVARSSIKMGWAGNVYYGVDHWIASERDFEALERQVPPERILTLHHRNLVRDPEGELARVCAFLGLAYDPAMLRYHETSTYDPPDPGFIEGWRKKLTPEEIGLVEGKAGAMMAARGFEASGYPRLQPGRLKRAALSLQNRAARIAFSIRRYGAVLTFLDIAGRRLPLGPIAVFARRKINEKTLQYLK